MTLVEQPAPNGYSLPELATPSGYILPDLADVVDEVGVSHALRGRVAQADEQFEDHSALDPVIFAGLLHP
jgi:hypothetical protein